MQGANSILEKAFAASGAITMYRFVKKGGNEDGVVQSSAAADATMGVSQHDAVNGKDVRVMLIGISHVEFGGNVTQGDFLVPDANGKAVAATRHTHTENTAGAYAQDATTGAGSLQRSGGIAMCDGVSGDIGAVLLNVAFV